MLEGVEGRAVVVRIAVGRSIARRRTARIRRRGRGRVYPGRSRSRRGWYSRHETLLLQKYGVKEDVRAARRENRQMSNVHVEVGGILSAGISRFNIT